MSSALNPVTVTQLTHSIVMLFESNSALRDVWVMGEVSNWKRAASGHVYFRLKDGGATINAVMWKGSAQTHSWLPRDGDQVMAHGYVGVYPEGGAYQLYANILRPAGKGQLYARFEELKTQLAAAGLFDAERKRPIPVQPRRIAVVTSADAAALRDILRVLSARWPLVGVTVYPCLVQGANAPEQIVAALAEANRSHLAGLPVDVIILARGGGSIEDLWAFNDERVAYAIAASELPVISGVGHETDSTIADFVADLRAPTPTAAAHAATPDRGEMLQRLLGAKQVLQNGAFGRIQQERRELDQSAARLRRVHPRRRLDNQYLALDERIRRLQGAMGVRLQRATLRQVAAGQRLHALSPERVLARGYSIVARADGTVVRGPDDAANGEVLRVRAARGAYRVARLED